MTANGDNKFSQPSASPQTPVAETARQEGAQGRVGKTPDDTVPSAMDESDARVAQLADKLKAFA